MTTQVIPDVNEAIEECDRGEKHSPRTQKRCRGSPARTRARRPSNLTPAALQTFPEAALVAEGIILDP
jgi:hypothetical protein